MKKYLNETRKINRCILILLFLAIIASLFFVPNRIKKIQNYSNGSEYNYRKIKIINDDKIHFSFTSMVDKMYEFDVMIRTMTNTKGDNYVYIPFENSMDFNFLEDNGEFLGISKYDNKIIFNENKKITDDISKEPYYIINLSTDNIKIVEDYKINFNEQKGNEIKLKFNEIRNIKWQKINFDIECVNCNYQNFGYIFLNDNDVMTIDIEHNNDKINSTINYNIYGRTENYNYVWIATIAFVLFTVYFIIKYYNSLIKKINNISFKKAMIIELFLSLICTICLYKLIVNSTYYDIFLFRYYIILLVLSIALLLIMCKYLFDNTEKMEKKYMTIIIPIALMMMVFILPNWVSDEDAHFYKMYSVSENHYSPVFMNSVPKVIVENNKELIKTYQKFDELTKIETNYNDTMSINGFANSYNSILYIIPSFGMRIARMMNINIFIGYYIARFFNLLFMIICGYYIIKIIPFGKLVTAIYMLSPMYIQQGMSLSIDCFINSICLLFIAYVLFLKSKNTIVSRKEFLYLLLLMLAISITKYVYTPICLFSIILMFSNNRKIDHRIIKIITCIILSFAISIFLYDFTNRVLIAQVTTQNSMTTATTAVNSALTNDVLSIIRHPFDYINILNDTIIKNSAFYVESFMGTQLGWFSIQLNSSITYIYLLSLLIAMYVDSSDYKFSKMDRMIALISSFITINAVFMAFYLSYVDYSQAIIHGVQGRYFIPVILLCILPLLKNQGKNFNNIETKLLLSVIIVNAFAILYIIKNFL